MKVLGSRSKQGLRFITPILGAWGLVAGSLAGAAVYNLYFNNVEQGDNSTASPSVVTTQDKNGKVETSKTNAEGEPVVTPTEEAAPEAETPAATPAPAPATTTALLPPPAKKEYPVRLMLSAGLIQQSVTIKTALLELAYFPLPYLGFNAFGGASGGEFDNKFVGGLEIELIPVKLNLFGFGDALEFAVLGGANTISVVDGNVASLHAGLRASLNFGDRWVLAGTGRLNAGFRSADIGLGFRF